MIAPKTPATIDAMKMWTKIEANENKCTFVRKKSIQTNKEKIKKQWEEIWNYVQNIAGQKILLSPQHLIIPQNVYEIYIMFVFTAYKQIQLKI